MKKFFFRLHLWLSLPFGIIIAITCLTGALLVFENELLEARYPERYFVEETTDSPLPVSQLVEKIQRQLPDTAQVIGIKMENDARRTYKIIVKDGDGNCFVNPYTGELTAKDERSTFFTQVLRLHRFLLHQYQRGETPWGKWIVGTATIVFIFILISGLFIWFPRNRKMLKRNLTIKTRTGRFRFWHDLHIAGGFYTALFLLLMAVTGLTWSFPWFRTPFYTFFGADPVEMSKGRSKPSSKEEPQILNYSTWDKMVQNMQERYPEYNTISILHNEVTVNYQDYGNIYARDQYRFKAEDGSIVQTTLNADRTTYSRLRNWVYALHTGNWGGLTSRILYALSTLFGVILVFTGYYFWIRKKIRHHKK